MILGLDADRAAGPRTGVGRNIEYLLREWAAQDIPFERIRVFSRTPVSDIPADDRQSREVVASRGPGLWWQVARLRPKVSEVDVFFSYYTLPPGYRGRSVVANLGVYEGAFAIPGWRSRGHSLHFAHSARRADAVIVNADSTKADLVNFYGVEPGKITVVWPGADKRFGPGPEEGDGAVDDAVADLLGDRKPFFLFVGKLSSRRHVPELLDAFSQISATRPQLSFLLAGPTGSDLDIRQAIDERGLGRSVRHVSHVDQDTLALLYRGARAFLMPTTREGFSHPILEALQSGCPVLALRGASLGVLEYIEANVPGGVEQAVLQAEGTDAASLAAGMEALSDDDRLCSKLRTAGLRAADSFPSWEEHARQVMAVLAEVAERR